MPVYEFDVIIEVDIRHQFKFKHMCSGASEQEARDALFTELNKVKFSKETEPRNKTNGLMEDTSEYGMPRKTEVRRLIDIEGIIDIHGTKP